MIEALIAGLCAAGVMVLSSGVYRLRRRTATSRRVAAVLANAPLAGPLGEPRPAARTGVNWRLELRQVLAQIEARDSILRGPAWAVACICALIGLATISPFSIGLALLAGLAAYTLGASERRRRRIEAQALDAMQLLASGLRAGYSVPQAIALVARHSPEPTASEFGLAAQEISVGVHLADAIRRLSRRTANPDYELVAIIIRVQYEVGGNLAQILDSVGNTLRERFDLRRQVNALTAQQRLSSLVLTLLPFGLLIFLFVMDRSFVDPLFTNPIGRLMLAGAGAMVFTGWTIMRSIGRVEVPGSNVFVDPRLPIALCAALGVCLLTAGVLRWGRRRRMQLRLRALSDERRTTSASLVASNVNARQLAARLGARLGQRLPGEVGSLAARVDRAGLTGGVPALELLGWKAVSVALGLAVGLWGMVRYGAPGLIMLVLGVLIGWFGIDVMLARFHQQRRRAILRDLPTLMDLLVLSLEAGMGLDRALRTVIHEYHSPLSDEIQRVLIDMDLGVGRGDAFERMARRVGLENLHALSRAIIQSEELGVSLVGAMQNHSREVRVSRRRDAEAEALRAPIKMLIPLVVFILPTLFLLLLGPVGLRAAQRWGALHRDHAAE